MGNERYPQNSNPGGYFNRPDQQDYGQDYGSGRDHSYSSARDYAAAGLYDRDRGNQRSRGGYGDAGYQQQGGWNDRDQNRSFGSETYGANRSYGSDRGYQSGNASYGGSYGDDGRRFTEGQQDRSRQDQFGRQGRIQQPGGGRTYGQQPQGYDYEERGFVSRAGDEVRSWFGDDEAQRRREMDARFDEQGGGENRFSGNRHDDDYHSWRRGQIDALDRDYHEYRQENRSKFENEFGSWRNQRQSQRSLLSSVTEHMDVVGSDGQHVGTVDKVRGDRIILTKNDAEAEGRHHSIPSRWLQSVDDKVTISKSADEAKSHWRDEERNQALFGDDQKDQSNRSGSDGPHVLNRSFSGTY